MSLRSPKYLPVVAGVVPAVFERYARILHPVENRDGLHTGPKFMTWKYFAERNGKIMHPLVDFGCIEDPPNRSLESGIQRYWCDWDSLEKESFCYLVGLLSDYTTTNDTCWFCQWEGNGITATTGPATFSRREGKPSESAVLFAESEYRSAPRVDNTHCKYVLFTGELSAANAFHERRGGWSPSIMWPEDRAWCVATELDLRSTYVGGADECIEAILNHPGLETFEAKPDDRIFSGADTINC